MTCSEQHSPRVAKWRFEPREPDSTEREGAHLLLCVHDIPSIWCALTPWLLLRTGEGITGPPPPTLQTEEAGLREGETCLSMHGWEGEEEVGGIPSDLEAGA